MTRINQHWQSALDLKGWKEGPTSPSRLAQSMKYLELFSWKIELTSKSQRLLCTLLPTSLFFHSCSLSLALHGLSALSMKISVSGDWVVFSSTAYQGEIQFEFVLCGLPRLLIICMRPTPARCTGSGVARISVMIGHVIKISGGRVWWHAPPENFWILDLTRAISESFPACGKLLAQALDDCGRGVAYRQIDW